MSSEPIAFSALQRMVAIVTLFLATAAQATNLDVQHFKNKSGGDAFFLECPAGSYLTGFNGRAGAWIDNLIFVCSPWLEAEQKLGASLVLGDRMVGSSGGGDPTSSNCPAGWVTTSVQLRFSDWDDSGVLHSITFNCTPIAGSAQRVSRSFGSTSTIEYQEGSKWDDGYWKDPTAQMCPQGEFVTGIHGRAGLFIDALGLICGPSPKRNQESVSVRSQGISIEEPAQTKKPTDSVVNPDDRGVVTKRTGGVVQPQ